jgi:hypothetical protein
VKVKKLELVLITLWQRNQFFQFHPYRAAKDIQYFSKTFVQVLCDGTISQLRALKTTVRPIK